MVLEYEDQLKSYSCQSILRFSSQLSPYPSLTLSDPHELQEMHKLGETRIMVDGVPPMDCLPHIKTLVNIDYCIGC